MDQDSDRLLSVPGRIVEGSAVFLGTMSGVRPTIEESGATLRGLQDPRGDCRRSARDRAGIRNHDQTQRSGRCRRCRAVALAALTILNKIGEGFVRYCVSRL
jgi:hypothetical protein